MVDKEDAVSFAFEKFVINKLPESFEKGYTFEVIDVPGTNEMVANPGLLPLRTWPETAREISTSNYSYAGYNDWKVATLSKARDIGTKFSRSSCKNYLAIFSLPPKRYYFLDHISDWRSDLRYIKQLTISPSGSIFDYQGFIGVGFILPKGKVLLWREK